MEWLSGGSIRQTGPGRVNLMITNLTALSIDDNDRDWWSEIFAHHRRSLDC